MNKKDVDAKLKDAEKRWKKKLQEDYLREPLFKDQFPNVPSTNPLYWDANYHVVCYESLFRRKKQQLKERINSALATTQTRNTSNSSLIKMYLMFIKKISFLFHPDH